jgi:hypothetical protein
MGNVSRLEQLPRKQMAEEVGKSLVLVKEIVFGVGDEITHPYVAEP